MKSRPGRGYACKGGMAKPTSIDHHFRNGFAISMNGGIDGYPFRLVFGGEISSSSTTELAQSLLVGADPPEGYLDRLACSLRDAVARAPRGTIVLYRDKGGFHARTEPHTRHRIASTALEALEALAYA